MGDAPCEVPAHVDGGMLPISIPAFFASQFIKRRKHTHIAERMRDHAI